MQRRHILAILVSTLPVSGFEGEDRIWREYLAWFRAQESDLPDPLKGFEEQLLRSGRSREEAAEATAIAARLMKERRDEWQAAFFDRTYASRRPRFNTQPNELLVESVRGIRPGRALDVHMGQGRNAIYLARLGWQVTGFDYSAEGVAAARAAASRANLSVTAVVSRHDGFDFGDRRWDLIVMSYTWLPLEAKWIELITRALKPGGLLVFEHLLDESGSQTAATWLPGPNELTRLFGHMRILRYEVVLKKADWSWRPERVARLVAERDPAIEAAHSQER